MATRKRVNRRLLQQRAETRQTKTDFAKLLAQPSIRFPRVCETLIGVPGKQGVYVIFDRVGRVLHVGRTYRGKAGLNQRIKNHLNGQSSFVHTYLKQNKGQLRKGYTFKYLTVGHARRRALLEHCAAGLLSPAHLGLGKSLKL
jgi:hypothetical protein